MLALTLAFLVVVPFMVWMRCRRARDLEGERMERVSRDLNDREDDTHFLPGQKQTRGKKKSYSEFADETGLN